MQEVISNLEKDLKAVLEHLREELSKIRAGRVSPAAVENISVEVYGAKMTLRELATIKISDPLELLIEPWDKSVLENIERALAGANLGASPVVSGGKIRLKFPPLTAEGRRNLIREVGEKVEEARLRVRKARQRARERADDFKDSEGEDFVFRLKEEIDEAVGKVGGKIEGMRREKEEEIRG